MPGEATAHCLYPLASARIKKTTLVVVFLIFCERMRASEKTTPLLGVAFLFFSTGKSVFLEDVDDLFFTLPDAILAEICDAEWSFGNDTISINANA